ncbi:class E sortase [Zafaria sp. Z1313]|uniref:class E sortase n=1 Tax=Zafaria sp. Z1313 TaxID=3423202 RepID=UPI003D303064
MDSTTPVRAARSRRAPGAGRRTPRVTFTGVLGELLITAGLVLLLFVAWELWWTNLEADRRQDTVAEQLLRGFDDVRVPGLPAGERLDPAAEAARDRAEFGAPPIAVLPHAGATFGVMYVPRFGADYARPVTDGVGTEVLDHLGIGRYPQTQMPGELGNFGVAAHRQTHGQVFWDIDKLTDGDRLYVQTAEGFYQYAYRSTEIVHPSQGEVLLPVPHQPGVEPTTSLLTLTSCDPPFTTRMRIIAYAELESFRPAAAGPQQAIADVVESTRGD